VFRLVGPKTSEGAWAPQDLCIQIAVEDLSERFGDRYRRDIEVI
jgi:hypothetical protein